MVLPYDVLVEHGSVVDGTGKPPFAAAVGVRDGRLEIVRGDTVAVQAKHRLDARGHVVAPGFIDLHSHAGLMLFSGPAHEPKVLQGITTEVVGVDGLSYAPLPERADLEALVDMNAGLDGRPPLRLDWSTVGSYLDRLDRLHPSVNVALLVGNTPLRIAEVGWNDDEASSAQVAGMRARLREAMQEGAFGLSSGLDYPPGSFATTDELAALTHEAARLGGFHHTHVRYALGDRFVDPFLEAIEIGRRGEGPTHLTHFYHRQTDPGPPERLLALVDEALAEGLDVTFDTYPYEWASTRLLIQLPQWVQSGGPRVLKERIAERGTRDRIRAELRFRGAAYASGASWADVRLGAFTRPENLRWESRTVADVMRETGADAVDVICELLLSENLGVSQVTTGPWTDGLRRFLAHPGAMIGTDGLLLGAKPSPRTYGSYPRVLGQFVRDEALLSLEEAVRRMTGAPAARLGLARRGLLRDGYAADLVVFDPARVRSAATYDEPRQPPEGIAHVLVNGQPVVADGRHTGATPGRALRLGGDR